MGVNWDGYQPYDPGVRGPLHELPRREARAAFARLMDAKDERIEALRRLAAANGVDLDDSDRAVQDLEDWFRAHVEPDPRAPDRLRPMWYAVVNDIALYLGELVIREAPHLRWTMFDAGKRNAAFQRHVIMGFTQASNPKYNLDIDMAVAAFGHRIIAGEQDDEPLFHRVLQVARSYA
jgi:hypothetical protein